MADALSHRRRLFAACPQIAAARRSAQSAHRTAIAEPPVIGHEKGAQTPAAGEHPDPLEVAGRRAHHEEKRKAHPPPVPRDLALLFLPSKISAAPADALPHGPARARLPMETNGFALLQALFRSANASAFLLESHDMATTSTESDAAPLVGIIMGSQSDWPTMRRAADNLDALSVPYETKIVSAHRTPERLYEYAKSARSRGLKAVIAGAGGAAHLPGMAAAMTDLPVIGVPVQSKALNGLDSLLSIVQMPKGVPVLTVAIGEAGAANAGLAAAAIIAAFDTDVAARLAAWREKQTAGVSETVNTSDA